MTKIEPTFKLVLTKDEASSLWDFVDTLRQHCSFRDYKTDSDLMTAVQSRLAQTKNQSEPVAIEVSRSEACNLWDLIAAARTCNFSQFQGWQFAVDMQRKIQQSADAAHVPTVARITQTSGGEL
jgi:hypothetical protein